MISVPVSSDRDYEVLVGARWQDQLNHLLSLHSKVLIIAPASLKEMLQLEHSHIFYTPDGESQKDVGTLREIWNVLGDLKVGRKDAIVGIGGGATTDLAGFAAATWLRGVEWYAFPTTLAAMVDAAIGGKTGINTDAGKNLVGSFYSPSRVVIDNSFLESLSDRDFSAGLAEVIKTGLIADTSIVDLLRTLTNIPQVRSHALDLIEKSVRVKAEVVSQDFKEGKLREILNFGHTFGHAVERASNYELRHGEAVSIGLVYALYLSELTSDLGEETTKLVIELLNRFGLPTSTPSGNWELLLNLMQGDKKSRNNQLRFIGLAKIGNPVWLESVAIDEAKLIYEKISS